MAKKNMPTGVKVISILYYIGAVVMLLIGLGLMFGAELLASLVPIDATTMALSSVILVIVGALFIPVAVLEFFIARGLWKGQPWARIVAIIFAAFGVLGGLSNLISGAIVGAIFNIVISGLIGYYLLLTNEVKKAFKK